MQASKRNGDVIGEEKGTTFGYNIEIFYLHKSLSGKVFTISGLGFEPRQRQNEIVFYYDTGYNKRV